MPARKRWPWVLGAVALVGGAATVVMMKRSNETRAPAEPYCEITAAPVLDGEGTGPVTLRYAFATGQRTEVTAITQTKIAETLTDGTKTSDDLAITLEGAVRWRGVRDGRFLGELEVATVGVDRRATHWRSDDAAAPPAEYKPLLVLLGQPAAIGVDARGEVTAPGIVTWQELLERAQASPALRAAVAEGMLRTMFVPLPAQPVTIGDHWPAGELVHVLPGGGSVRAKIELRVAAISKDGMQVVLDATPELRVDGARKSAVRMWSQFDVQRRDVVASALRVCADVELASGITSRLDLAATYDSFPLAASP